MENRKSEDSYFITLTYDNDHLPHNGVSVDDCQKFLKRLRKKIRFRYFLVSEYGDRFMRPHYHFLLFSKSQLKMQDCLHSVDNSWQKGNVMIGDVTPASIAYCSKYSLKDKTIPSKVDPLSGEITEYNRTFALMSRRPGIGSEVLADASFLKNVFAEQFLNSVEGQRYLLPRYYRDKVFTPDLKISYYDYLNDYLEKANKKFEFTQKYDRDWLFHESKRKLKDNSR